MTSDDLKWPQMTSKNEIRQKYVYMGIILTQIQFYFNILTFRWPQMSSGDLRWPQMTSDDQKKKIRKKYVLMGIVSTQIVHFDDPKWPQMTQKMGIISTQIWFYWWILTNKFDISYYK